MKSLFGSLSAVVVALALAGVPAMAQQGASPTVPLKPASAAALSAAKEILVMKNAAAMYAVRSCTICVTVRVNPHVSRKNWLHARQQRNFKHCKVQKRGASAPLFYCYHKHYENSESVSGKAGRTLWRAGDCLHGKYADRHTIPCRGYQTPIT